MAISRAVYALGRALRETGQAVDRVGLRALDYPVFKESFSRHRSVSNLFDKHPWMSPDVYVAPNATVIGSVDINMSSSVMYGAVVRGDFNKVDIGAYTSIGDRAVVCTNPTVEGMPNADVRIGDHVSIGAGAVLQSCTVERCVKVGAGSVVMEGALLEEYSELAPNSVVHPGRRIPKGEEWGGNPAVFLHTLPKEVLNHRMAEAEEQATKATEHADMYLPVGFNYKGNEKLVLPKPVVE